MSDDTNKMIEELKIECDVHGLVLTVIGDSYHIEPASFNNDLPVSSATQFEQSIQKLLTIEPYQDSPICDLVLSPINYKKEWVSRYDPSKGKGKLAYKIKRK